RGRQHPGDLRAPVRHPGRRAGELWRPVLQLFVSLGSGLGHGQRAGGQSADRPRLRRRNCQRALSGAHPHPARHRSPRGRGRSGRRATGRDRRQARLRLRVRAGRRAGCRRRRPGRHVPHAERRHGGGVHHQGADRGDHGRRRQSHGGAGRRPAARDRRDLRGAAGRSGADARRQLRAVPRRAAVAADRPVRERGALTTTHLGTIAALVITAGIAAVPLVAGPHHVALGISLLSFTVLATALAPISGPPRYISLPTVACFGIGAYTVGALGETLPWWLVLLVAAAIGVAVALVVGLSTLRLSGMYFVIFTFGLSELIRQIVTWYEVNVHRSVGRYV